MKKTKNDGKRYIVVYQKEADGDICIEYCKSNEIRNLLEKYRLHYRDIAIIEGTLVKGFDKDW